MCGIVCVISDTVTAKHKKIFKEMLFYDTVRGRHSTGIVQINKKLEVDTFKRAVEASDFLQLGRAKTLIESNDSKVLLGHNRHATIGGVSHDTAHPFTHGNITGVHNGTIRNTYPLDDNAKFKVDSENIMYHLSRNTLEETTPNLRGAYALAWYDSDKKTMNFIRNDERPLWYAASKDGKALLVASEPWMIKVACHRNDLEISPVSNLKEGIHLSVNVEKFPNEDSVEANEVDITVKYGNVNQSNVYRGSYGSSSSSSSTTSTNKSKPEDQRIQAATEALKNKSKRRIVPKEERTVELHQLRRVANKSTNDFSYMACGVDTVSGDRSIVYLTEEVYKNALSNVRNLLKVSAPYLAVARSEDGSGSWPHLILDGRQNVRLHFKEWTTRVSNGKASAQPENNESKSKMLDDDIPFEKDKEDTGRKVLSLKDATVQGYNGRPLTMRKFNEITKCGCANCSDRVSFEDAKSVEWISEEAFYCADCKELNELGKI